MKTALLGVALVVFAALASYGAVVAPTSTRLSGYSGTVGAICAGEAARMERVY
jgi:hypothetical protein